MLTGGMVLSLTPNLVHAQSVQTTVFCRLTQEAIAQKDALFRAALQGDRPAADQYRRLIQQHGEAVQRCRRQTWPQEQALWIRLYPCDAKPGALDRLFDQIVNWGYNTIYVETFYNGLVLLPEAENATPWPSVIRHPDHQHTDLLALAIAKGRERGMRVYSWMFTMNFGYSYAQRGDRQDALAINGQGHTSLSASDLDGGVGSEEAFIDPYSPQAKQDYEQLLQAVLRRQPDGVLFDYVRYPRGEGGNTVASRVQDLWIYGSASQQALQNRALNPSGQAMIQRYLAQGYLSNGDVAAIESQYSEDGDAQWQGRLMSVPPDAPPAERTRILQDDLWRLTVAHAIQGVLDFLSHAIRPVAHQGLASGAVFFPGGNDTVNSGYDARLQPWDRFPQTIEWHPMVYGVCGDSSCIVSEVQQVLAQATSPTQVKPVLAGVWGQPMTHRPSLEAQMAAIHRAAPHIQSISHFAYSWQDPQTDRVRKFCQL